MNWFSPQTWTLVVGFAVILVALTGVVRPTIPIAIIHAIAASLFAILFGIREEVLAALIINSLIIYILPAFFLRLRRTRIISVWLFARLQEPTRTRLIQTKAFLATLLTVPAAMVALSLGLNVHGNAFATVSGYAVGIAAIHACLTIGNTTRRWGDSGWEMSYQRIMSAWRSPSKGHEGDDPAPSP